MIVQFSPEQAPELLKALELAVFHMKEKIKFTANVFGPEHLAGLQAKLTIWESLVRTVREQSTAALPS